MCGTRERRGAEWGEPWGPPRETGPRGGWGGSYLPPTPSQELPPQPRGALPEPCSSNAQPQLRKVRQELLPGAEPAGPSLSGVKIRSSAARQSCRSSSWPNKGSFISVLHSTAGGEGKRPLSQRPASRLAQGGSRRGPRGKGEARGSVLGAAGLGPRGQGVGTDGRTDRELALPETAVTWLRFPFLLSRMKKRSFRSK